MSRTLRMSAGLVALLTLALIAEACSNNRPPLLRRLSGATRFVVMTDLCAASADAERRNFAVLASPQLHGLRIVDLDSGEFFDEPQLRPLPLTVPTGRHPNAIAGSADQCLVFATSPVDQSVTVLDFASILATNTEPEALNIDRLDLPLGGIAVDVVGAPEGADGDTVAWIALHAAAPGRSEIHKLRRSQVANFDQAFSSELAYELEGQIARLTVVDEASGPALWVALDGLDDTEAVRIDIASGEMTRVELGAPTRQILEVPAGDILPGSRTIEAGRYLMALRATRPGIAVIDLAHEAPPEASPTPTATPTPTPTATPAPAAPVWLDLGQDAVESRRFACERSAAHCDLPLPSLPLSLGFSDRYSVNARTRLDGCTGSAETQDSPYPNQYFAVVGTLDGVAYLIDLAPEVFGIADANADRVRPSLITVDDQSVGNGTCFATCDVAETPLDALSYTSTECLQPIGSDSTAATQPETVGCANGIIAKDPPSFRETWTVTWEGTLPLGSGSVSGRFCPNDGAAPQGCPEAPAGLVFTDPNRNLVATGAALDDILVVLAPGEDAEGVPDCSGDYRVVQLDPNGAWIQVEAVDEAPDAGCTETFFGWQLRATESYTVRSSSRGFRGRTLGDAPFDDPALRFRIRPNEVTPERGETVTLTIDGNYCPMVLPGMSTAARTRVGQALDIQQFSRVADGASEAGVLVLWGSPDTDALVFFDPERPSDQLPRSYR